MATLGRSPGAAPLTSADIPDGSVTAAKIATDTIAAGDVAPNAIGASELADDAVDTAAIADNAVTLAKMAGGTDGNIISYDASGDPVAIATGDDGEVLTSAGAGQPPAFEAAGGGAWNFIYSYSASGSGSIAFVHGTDGVTFDATYNLYIIVVQNLIGALDNKEIEVLTTNDGSSYESSYNGANTRNIAGTESIASMSTTIATAGSVGNVGGECASMILYIPNPADANTYHSAWGTAITSDDGGNTRANFFGGMHKTAEAFTGIKFVMSAGNIASGKFSLYGLTT